VAKLLREEVSVDRGEDTRARDVYQYKRRPV